MNPVAAKTRWVGRNEDQASLRGDELRSPCHGSRDYGDGAVAAGCDA
jgi:hypothetical protein